MKKRKFRSELNRKLLPGWVTFIRVELLCQLMEENHEQAYSREDSLYVGVRMGSVPHGINVGTLSPPLVVLFGEA